MPRLSRLARIAGHVAIALAWAGIVVWMLWRGLNYQWDLWPYYYGARAWASGLDPYLLESLREISGEGGDFRFRYPLIILYLFWPLTWFSYETAWCIWLGLKLAALGGLLVVWRRIFLRDTDGLLMSFAILLGFNAAVVYDVITGNKTTYEQLLLWLGFAALVRSRLWHFSAATVAASLFNIFPAAFLGLLMGVRERKRGIIVMVCAIAVLVLLVIAPYATQPELLGSMIGSNKFSAHETGTNSPSLMGFLFHCKLMWPTSVMASEHVRLIALLVYISVIISFSVRPLLRTARDGDIRYLILLATVTYCAAMPRMMSYSYMLLIPPALLAIHHLWRDFAPRMLAVAIMSMPVRFLFEAPVPDAPALLEQLSIPGFIAYYPWLLALVLWGLYVTGKVKLTEGKSDAADIAVVQ